MFGLRAHRDHAEGADGNGMIHIFVFLNYNMTMEPGQTLVKMTGIDRYYFKSWLLHPLTCSFIACKDLQLFERT
jgi:hypothetical protein